MAMSSGSDTPSNRCTSRITRSSARTDSPLPMARRPPSITRRPSVNPRRPRSATARATVSYSRDGLAGESAGAVMVVLAASADPDGLDVDELTDALLGELPAVAGTLDAAEGQTRVRLDDAVHEHRAGLDLRGEPLRPNAILRPQRRAEPEHGVVGQPDGIAFVLGPDDRGHGTEGLLVESRHALVHPHEERGRIEGAAAGGHLAAQEQAGAVLHRLLDLVMERVAELDAGLRAPVRAAVHRIAHAARGELSREEIEKALGDRVHHDEALGRDAALPAVDEASVRGCLGGRREVGVGQYDERIAAAQLQHRLLDL